MLWANALSIACVGAALWLAASDYNGWGWFLFAALFCAQSSGCKCDNNDDE